LAPRLDLEKLSGIYKKIPCSFFPEGLGPVPCSLFPFSAMKAKIPALKIGCRPREGISRGRKGGMGATPMGKHLRIWLIAIFVAGLVSVPPGTIGRGQSAPDTRPTHQATNSDSPASQDASFALKGTSLLSAPVTEGIREEQRQQIIRYFLAQIAATPA